MELTRKLSQEQSSSLSEPSTMPTLLVVFQAPGVRDQVLLLVLKSRSQGLNSQIIASVGGVRGSVDRQATMKGSRPRLKASMLTGPFERAATTAATLPTLSRACGDTVLSVALSRFLSVFAHGNDTRRARARGEPRQISSSYAKGKGWLVGTDESQKKISIGRSQVDGCRNRYSMGKKLQECRSRYC